MRGLDLSQPTPQWMQEKLRRGGVRSLGPAVDVTNYVLLELGQPMHAFDLAKIDGGIVVRMGRGEDLKLLDETSVKIDSSTWLSPITVKPWQWRGLWVATNRQ